MLMVPAGDGGTTELWVPAGLQHDLVGVIGTYLWLGDPEDLTRADGIEHWLVFGDGVDSLHSGLKPFPAGHPPVGTSSTGQVVKLQDSQRWELHQDQAGQALAFSAFVDKAIPAIADAYGVDATALKGYCRGYSGTFSRRPLQAGSGQSNGYHYRDTLLNAQVGAVSRVFQVRTAAIGGSRIGRIYAEAPNAASVRRVHQYSHPTEGIVKNDGSFSHYKHEMDQDLEGYLDALLAGGTYADWHFATGTISEVVPVP